MARTGNNWMAKQPPLPLSPGRNPREIQGRVAAGNMSGAESLLLASQQSSSAVQYSRGADGRIRAIHSPEALNITDSHSDFARPHLPQQ